MCRFPMGVRDPESGRALLRVAPGVLLALELLTGQEVQTWELDARPLAVTDEGWLIQHLDSEDFQFALLPFDEKTTTFTSEGFELPDALFLEDEPHEHYHWDATFAHGSLVFRWEATLGTPPGAYQQDSASARPRGSLRWGGEAEGGGEVKGGGEIENLAASGLSELPTSATYRRHLAWHERGWRCGAMTCHLVRDSEGLQLVTSAGEHAIPCAALSIATVSEDGAHLLCYTPDADEDWRIYEVESGALVGAIPRYEGADMPCLVGDTLFTFDALYEPRLVAQDLLTGEERWTLPFAGIGEEGPSLLAR